MDNFDFDNSPILRIVTCGSVDDGKSTMLGRMIYECGFAYEDQIEEAKKNTDNAQFGMDEIDYSLLLDGLDAEREQKITIDVAYRYFSTPKRKFIVADAPGHVQYTCNMVTAASNCNLAILLIDARKGLLLQSKRHLHILSLLGIKNLIVAVNKMDLIGYDCGCYHEICSQISQFIEPLNFKAIHYIPLSAKLGENIKNISPEMSFYNGAPLINLLENFVIEKDISSSFRMPVQLVFRPHLDFRGFAGTIMGGEINVGDQIMVASSGQISKVKKIITFDGELRTASNSQAITLCLEDELDISRGDVLIKPNHPMHFSDMFQARIIWFSNKPVFQSRRHLIKLNHQYYYASIMAIKYKIAPENLAQLAARKIEFNEIAVVDIAVERNVAFDAYNQNKDTGSFIIIDQISGQTLGAGMITHSTRRADNIRPEGFAIQKNNRAKQKHQTPKLIWLTGLSGAGKSTIANQLERRLFELNFHTYILDGDNVRHGINKDLGFTEADRIENIRRVGEVASLMLDAGLIVIASFISPFMSDRQAVRAKFEMGEFVEVFVDVPLEIAKRRDPKGLYAKAIRGEIKNFTGIDSPYEISPNPEITIHSDRLSIDEAVQIILDYILKS